ncbi:SRPBCC domain-containing protein [Plectonema cf. radiosum LEGE 06105]|uniref:SRPBCC domain-containing protein n=1 Tax=Plectonema cf. radiosum LEGE 06105 TaxID=945769 RepID=A0A8J7F294_9CYAN|nr:SRPBCC domain-containing protein [Plectonema radiosum]MBE9213542.1 SRPBCC domain-containing protein [Plectonema cf. radiosum LEGE 06105]
MLGLSKEIFYPYSPERVWLLLTNSRTLAKWLMENDFEPRVGCKFCFYSQSLPGIDTNIRCEVIEVDEPNRLVYTWQDCMMSQSSIVIWTLKAVEGGTQLRLQHRIRETAFTAVRESVYSQRQSRYIKASDSFILASYLNGGWEKKLCDRLPFVLGETSSV